MALSSSRAVAAAVPIDRRLVAAAFDRTGAQNRPDGVVSREELAAAGVTRVEEAALAVINAPGEAGDAITVGELARALAADRVSVSSRGAVVIEQGRARLDQGVVVPASPWAFPEVPDLDLLEGYHRLVPRLRRFHPDYPDGQYVDRVFKGYERVQTGTRRVPDGKDAQGNQQYRTEPVYEDRPRYEDEVQYDRLVRDLRRKAEEVLALGSPESDPELKAARERLKTLHESGGGTFGWGAERRSRDYYRALQAYDRIQVPTRPAALMGQLDASIASTIAAIDAQDRIVEAVPLERARRAIAAEVSRLRGVTAMNVAAGALAASGGGAAACFFIGGSLTALPLVAAVAGAGLAAGAIAWGVTQLVKNRSASRLERDLAVLEAIDPAANRKEAEQHALASYRLLQDARTADFLAALRGFEADTNKVALALGAVQQRAESQLESLKTVEGWALRDKA